MSLHSMIERLRPNTSRFQPMQSSLLAINDPLVQLKSTPAIAARRAKMTKVVKVIVGTVAMIGVLAGFRVTFANAAEEGPAVAESTSDRDRVVRSVDLELAKGPKARGVVRVEGRSTKAYVATRGHR